ncbi:MAG: NAD(+) diphosphatase [Methanospirillum sp.]
MSGGPRTTSSRSRTPFALDAFDLAFRPGPPGPDARYVYLQDDRVLLDRTAGRVLSAIPPSPGAPVLALGCSGNAAVSAVLLGPGDMPPGALEPVGLRDLSGMVGDEELGWASRAAQLASFDLDHRFCGRCGRPAAPSPVEHARICTGCGATVYPRLSPAVIVLVERGTSCLLARSPRFPSGVYSAIAGFVEPGETAEHAAERELAEECGVAATDLRYAGSQPWPFPHSLMLGFSATYAGGEVRADGIEVEDAGWFEADALPTLPAAGSIARRLIEEFAVRVSTRDSLRSGSA